MNETVTVRADWMPAMDIPGYEGKYFVREDGTVWRRCKTKDRQLLGHRKRRSREIKLRGNDGICRAVSMSAIMRLTWFRGMREDWALMHINGLEADWSIHNLKPMPREELGKMRNRNLSAKSVIKRDPKTMKILAFYKSAREAGRKNYMSYQAVLDACNKKNKKRTGIGTDGYLYEWEN